MAKRTNGVRSESRLPIHGLKACLDQLHDEAIAQGYGLVAAEPVNDFETVTITIY